jgi:DNA modification methylase
VGFSFPELVWKQGKHFFIVDGHQRVRAIQQMLKEGYALKGGELPVSFTEAKNKKEAAKKIAMGTSQYGEYDEESMYEFMHLAGLELEELKEWGSLPQLHMGKLEVGYFGDVDPKDDEVPEPPKKAITKPGDLWELGDHRLLCGDSTKGGTVNALTAGKKVDATVTDPPYSVDYDRSHSKRGGSIEAHAPYHEVGTNADAVLSFLCVVPSDVVIMSYPIDRHFSQLASAIKKAGFVFCKELVWVKDTFSFWPSAKYQQKHEPILWLVRNGAAMGGNVPANETTVHEFPKPKAHELHPTAKPVNLWAKFISYHVRDRGGVFDPFLGSGTTMIVAEKLNRRCYGIEIEPKYVDVAVERWEQFTGKKAKRVKAK